MRVLFLHNNFPAQWRHAAATLAADPKNVVVFGTQRREGQIPGVRKAYYKPARAPNPKIHHYIRNLEEAVLNGQAVWRLCMELKKRGFVPDVVCAHSGWGPGLYVKDAFPDTRLLCYFEWYYHARGTDADFLPDSKVGEDDLCRIRTRNAPILLDLAAADWGQVPTRFQWSQFPEVFHSKLTVLHDGIDADFFKPAERPERKFGNLDLSGAREIVTYSTRGMEPYRGFPEFMRAAAKILARRPDCHVVVVGQDRVAYGRQLPEGESWKKRMLAELAFDKSRLHFTGLLPYPEYLKMLQASHAHVYLTVPFVLSWSLLEAMSTGCLVVGSATPPIQEVMRDGETGLLTDFFDVDALAARIEDALDHQAKYAPIRAAARRFAVKHYALKDLQPRQLRLIRSLAAGQVPPKLDRELPAAKVTAQGRIRA